MAFQGFGKNTGPIGPPKAQTPFGNFPRGPSPPSTFPPSSRMNNRIKNDHVGASDNYVVSCAGEALVHF
ncbi:hypothetical protein HAX54_037379 [Datura stramonium]|uniref:Uncharacterized protein n=1 Tax=Datura stramonium TaxID=4076 RepID=A0ABS8VLG4_DATST|nr:hypothetical protein [Datura stramonium]